MQESGAGNDAKTEEKDVEGAVCAAVQGHVKDPWIYLGVSEFLFATGLCSFPDLFCGMSVCALFPLVAPRTL